MDSNTIALLGIALALLGNAIVHLFKSPKESARDMERRVGMLESLHTTLALRFEGSHSRHDEALENLTEAVEKLTSKFERFLEQRNGGH